MWSTKGNLMWSTKGNQKTRQHSELCITTGCDEMAASCSPPFQPRPYTSLTPCPHVARKWVSTCRFVPNRYTGTPAGLNETDPRLYSLADGISGVGFQVTQHVINFNFKQQSKFSLQIGEGMQLDACVCVCVCVCVCMCMLCLCACVHICVCM